MLHDERFKERRVEALHGLHHVDDGTKPTGVAEEHEELSARQALELLQRFFDFFAGASALVCPRSARRLGLRGKDLGCRCASRKNVHARHHASVTMQDVCLCVLMHECPQGMT